MAESLTVGKEWWVPGQYWLDGWQWGRLVGVCGSVYLMALLSCFNDDITIHECSACMVLICPQLSMFLRFDSMPDLWLDVVDS